MRLDAARHGVGAFGAVLPARELGNGLLAQLDACRSLTRYAPAKLTAIETTPDAITARLATSAGERVVRARLLVGADGTNSFVRSALSIQKNNVDYAQTAFVCTATPEQAPDGRAFERFTASGPVALLPLSERRVGVVLTVPAADAERVAALDDAGFVELLQERVGYRLGRLARPGRRVSYPLVRVQAQRLSATARVVLVGKRRGALHPIGAQGFNLGAMP